MSHSEFDGSGSRWRRRCRCRFVPGFPERHEAGAGGNRFPKPENVVATIATWSFSRNTWSVVDATQMTRNDRLTRKHQKSKFPKLFFIDFSAKSRCIFPFKTWFWRSRYLLKSTFNTYLPGNRSIWSGHAFKAPKIGAWHFWGCLGRIWISLNQLSYGCNF